VSVFVNKASAVTVSYFSDLSLLRELLASLFSGAESLYSASQITFTHYIVDNSCDDDYFSQLQALSSEFESTKFFSFKLYRAPQNLGFSDGNNFINDKIHSDYHLIINPDVTIEPDALLNAIQYLIDNVDVVMVTPKVTDGIAVKHVVKSYPDVLTLLVRYFDNPYLNNLFKSRLARYQCEYLHDQADKNMLLAGGCFLLLKTDAFIALGGFDQRFFLYFEDYDFSLRVHKLGKIAYVPTVKITHMGGHAGKKNIKHHVYFVVSAFKFWTIHGWRLW
jgi:GT2 family glycosyltransferase